MAFSSPRFESRHVRKQRRLRRGFVLPAGSTSSEDAARILRLSRDTVHDYIRTGRLPGQKLAYGMWVVGRSTDDLRSLRQQWDLEGIERRRSRRRERPDAEVTAFLSAARSLSFVHPAVVMAEDDAYDAYRVSFDRKLPAVAAFYELEVWRAAIHKARAIAFAAVAEGLSGVEGCSDSVRERLMSEAATQTRQIEVWSRLIAEVKPSAADLSTGEAVGDFAENFEDRWRRRLSAMGHADMAAAFVLEQRWAWFYGRSPGFHRDRWTPEEVAAERQAWFRYHVRRAVELVEEMNCARDTSGMAYMRLRKAREATLAEAKRHTEVSLGIERPYMDRYGIRSFQDIEG